MDRRLFVMCVSNHIDPHIPLRDLRIMLESKINELYHYQTSLRFKMDTFRLFYTRQRVDIFNEIENTSFARETTRQLRTIQSIKELLQGIFNYVRALQLIYFRKLQIQGGPSSAQ